MHMGQPDLQLEFQDSQGYTGKTCLKKAKKEKVSLRSLRPPCIDQSSLELTVSTSVCFCIPRAEIKSIYHHTHLPFFKIYFIYSHMCISESVHHNVCGCLQRSERPSVPWNWSYSTELLYVGAGNQTQVLWKMSQCY